MIQPVNQAIDAQLSSDIVIETRNVAKTYRLYPSHQDRLKEALHPFRKIYHKEFWALRDVTFDIRRGERVGIIGRNGAGKSTILRLIAGVAQPTSGLIQVNGKVAALLELGSGFNPDITGRENVILSSIILGVAEEEIADRVSAVEAFADINQFFDQPMKVYSSGMYARVAFANAIHVNPDILIVDEILGVGDAKFQEKCHRKLEELSANGVSILFVSHSVNVILQLCNRCILLEKGQVKFFGATKEAVNAYHALLYGNNQERKLSNDLSEVLADSVSENKMAVNASGSDQALMTVVNRDLDRWLNDNSPGERFKNRRSFNKGHARLGSGLAQIIDYTVVCGMDFDVSTIGKGVEVDIYLKVHYRSEVASPIVGMALTTLQGVNVYGTNTELLGVSLTSRKAQAVCIYRFSFRSCLSGGHYFLNLGVACRQPDGEMGFLDNLRSIAHLIFERTPLSTGFVDVCNTFEEKHTFLPPFGGHTNRPDDCENQ